MSLLDCHNYKDSRHPRVAIFFYRKRGDTMSDNWVVQLFLRFILAKGAVTNRISTADNKHIGCRGAYGLVVYSRDGFQHAGAGRDNQDGGSCCKGNDGAVIYKKFCKECCFMIKFF